MDFNNINNLKENGFLGFNTIDSLWSDKTCIPKVMGVYLVLNQSDNQEFIAPGVGGFFKGKDPNVSLETLKENYVANSLVIYIGKAGGPATKATLHSRIGQYLKFGQGENVGHRGGRLIWQLKKHQELLFCWKPLRDEAPRNIEESIINDFVMRYGKKPFANLVK